MHNWVSLLFFGSIPNKSCLDLTLFKDEMEEYSSSSEKSLAFLEGTKQQDPRETDDQRRINKTNPSG